MSKDNALIEIFMSTVNGENVKKFLSDNSHLGTVKVINQGVPSSFDKAVLNINTIGLSKSRNVGIELSGADYVLLTDNDTIYSQDFMVEMNKIIRDCNFPAAIWFRSNLNKKYPIRSKTVGKITTRRCSSIELLYNREFLIKNGIRFDERFGLGADNISGEENIILSEIISCGGNVFFHDYMGVSHAGASSGENFESEVSLSSKGALFARLYGLMGFLYCFLFFFKKIKLLRFRFKSIFFILRGFLNEVR